MEYLKIFTDFARSVEALDDAERGRLFMAMLTYADRGEITPLPGNERFVWPTARLHIDREAAFCEKQRQRGSKRLSRTKPEEAEASRSKPDGAEASHKDKDNDKDNDKDPPSSPEGEDAPRPRGRYANIPLTDGGMARLQQEFPADWQQRLDRLSEYVAATGKVYQDHLAVLRSWARRDAEEAPRRAGGGRARAAPAPAASDRDEWLKRCVRAAAGK